MRKCALMGRASALKLTAPSADQLWCSMSILLRFTSGIASGFPTTRHTDSALPRVQLSSRVKMGTCSWLTWYWSPFGVSSHFSASSLTSMNQNTCANWQSHLLNWATLRLVSSKREAQICLMGYRRIASCLLCQRCCSEIPVQMPQPVWVWHSSHHKYHAQVTAYDVRTTACS